jgi:hypothetical protein
LQKRASGSFAVAQDGQPEVVVGVTVAAAAGPGVA